jgi:hypothetical protein
MIGILYRFITHTNFEVSEIDLLSIVLGGLWEDWELSFWPAFQNLK